uniref:Uncharacterized protein n=1 Tax=viral metagenome TaxID=1070528 RepID=A0A6C0LGV1_9ZZZZ
MGNYCCCFSKKQTLSYEIILKLPHDNQCFQLANNTWNYKEDVNAQLRECYKKPFTHWIVYNDETPEKTVSTGAHAKGIVAWNDKCISWLIHSVPKFPKAFDGTNQFPDIDHGELIYGQSFVFIKMGIEHLDGILNQVFIMHPNIYICNFDYSLYKDLHKSKQDNIYKINNSLEHVTKSPHYHIDVYEGILLPAFGGPIHTETWIRGHELPDSDKCKKAAAIHWEEKNLAYTYTHDHSKYCYSDKGWTAIGDLNRMTSQEKRGGGFLVIRDIPIAQLFKRIML